MRGVGEHRPECMLNRDWQGVCDCDPNHRELPVTIPTNGVLIAARALCPASTQGGPCSRCCDAVAGGIARGQASTLVRELELQDNLQARLEHPAEGHVLDRYGNVWAVVRDGGMVTRADYAGILTMGIAIAEAQIGPLVTLEAMDAKVTTYGGASEYLPGGVQHWQLRVAGEFIADTSQPRLAALFERIARRLA